MINKTTIEQLLKKIKPLMIVLDVIIILFGVYLSFLLRNNLNLSSLQINFLYIASVFTVVLKILIYWFLHIYRISLQYFSLKDISKIVLANLFFSTLASIIVLIFDVQHNYPAFYKSVIFYEFFIGTFLILSLRIGYRILRSFISNLSVQKIPVLIFGVDTSTDSVIRYLRNGNKYNPVGILTTRKSSTSLSINGLRTYSLTDDKNKFSKNYKVIIACKEDSTALIDIYQKLQRQGYKDIENFSAIEKPQLIKNISLEELLSRDKKLFDDTKLNKFISNKTILITGAGGSIGSEIVRQCLTYNAKLIVLIDNCEYNLYRITEETAGKQVIPVLLSVIDSNISKVFQKYKPDIVIHAAAYKHVPLAENNAYQVFKNNVVGTKNCIDCSIKYEVDTFILISTDKAVRPTNVMGATKRVCELYAQNVISNNTKIIAVRFGNVLGSSGSVIPKFQEQIKEGGPVTVTHPEITRYFMLINEACKLVLYAGAIGKRQELMVLDMGKPVKIADFARTMIALSGRSDIKITFTGLRPGEKLYEELLIDNSDVRTENDMIYITKSTAYDLLLLENQIKEIVQQKKSVIVGLQEIVKEYRPKI